MNDVQWSNKTYYPIKMDTIACEIATNEKMLDDNIGCIITKDMNNCKKICFSY